MYTVFCFPGLLVASAAMGGYMAGSGGTSLAQNRTFLLAGSFILLGVAVYLNIIGLNVGKWLQNAGGVGTYIPLLILTGLAAVLCFRHGSAALRIGFVGVLAAMLVSVGNAGGVGSTVAGIARVPFVVGIDRYLPEAFGKIHPRWKTPHISILVQAVISGAILLFSQINETMRGAYQFLVDAAIILYFIPFLYMYAAAIKLAGRKDRWENPQAVLIPGGKVGVWIAGGLGFLVVLGGIAVSLVPPGDSSDKLGFELKLVGGTLAAIVLGLVLYFRGARTKSGEAAAGN